MRFFHARTSVKSLFAGGGCLLSLVLSCAVQAHHPEDACPDTHVDGPNTIDGVAVHETTWEEFADGAHLPIGTPLRITARGTAIGYCDKYAWGGAGCISAPREYKDFVGGNFWQHTQNSQKNAEEYIGAPL